MDGRLRYRCPQQWVNTGCVRRIRHRTAGYRLNPLEEYDDAKFRLRFRLRKDSVIKFTAILEHQTRRGLPLTPMQQVFLTLRFYATASFHQVIGDVFGMPNYAVSLCKVIHRVARAISKHKRRRREAFTT